MSKATSAATKEQLVELMQYLSQNISVPTIGIGGGFAPIGTIISYMGTTAPQDYLICDGTTYNIADYKQLSDFFAAQFGSANFFGGDGVTTFKVPDLRGEFLRGTGTNSHTNQGNGANVGVHQDGTQHPNLFYDSIQSICVPKASPAEYTWYTPLNQDKGVGSVSKYKYNTTSGTEVEVSGSESFTSRPTNTSVLYCIKAVAAGDVYSTTERVVGTWIDGKPVYQRTYSLNTALPAANASPRTVEITLSGLSSIGIDTVTDMSIIVKGQDYYANHWLNRGCGESLGAFIDVSRNLLKMYQKQTNDSNQFVVKACTIWYTKTTD